MENKISMQGFIKNQQGKLELVNRIDAPKIGEAYNFFDGKRLDELQVTAILKTGEDFKELSNLLSVHRYCFWTPPKEDFLLDVTKLEKYFSDFMHQNIRGSAYGFFQFLKSKR